LLISSIAKLNFINIANKRRRFFATNHNFWERAFTTCSYTIVQKIGFRRVLLRAPVSNVRYCFSRKKHRAKFLFEMSNVISIFLLV